jgi:hypothetical protein
MATMRWVVIASLSCVFFSQLPSRPSALADSFFIHAGGDHDWGPSSGGISESSQHPVGDSSTMIDGFGHANVSAVATYGLVGGSIDGAVFAPALQTRRFNPNVTAVAHGFDVEHLNFTGPAAMVQTRAHFNMHGALSFLTHHTGPDPYAGNLGRVVFEHTLNFTKTRMELRIQPDNQFSVFENQFENVFPTFVNGQLFFVGGANASTPLIEVPTNVPVPTIFRLELSYNHLSNGFGGTSNFNSDFSSTFSWATGRPVFDLPDGYTVNGFGIEDNFFVIPEPACWVLLLLAAAGGYLRGGRAAF